MKIYICYCELYVENPKFDIIVGEAERIPDGYKLTYPYSIGGFNRYTIDDKELETEWVSKRNPGRYMFYTLKPETAYTYMDNKLQNYKQLLEDLIRHIDSFIIRDVDEKTYFENMMQYD